MCIYIYIYIYNTLISHLRFAGAFAVPFLPMYAWVGVWTSGMLLLAALANLSGLIR